MKAVLRAATMMGAVILAAGVTSGCGQKGWPLASVDSIDLQRYAGHWFEVARYPALFQAGCSRSQALYEPQDDGTVAVTNTCQRGGRVSNVRGVAYVPNAEEPGHLEVVLRVPVAGDVRADYYVLALDPDYQWALVGHPTRQYLWILSREPGLAPERITHLVSQAENEFGYNDAPRHLQCTEQDGVDVDICRDAVRAASLTQQQS